MAALTVSRRANSTAFRASAAERSGVVLGRGFEPQQLGQLASRISSVVTRGCQQTESFDVLAPGALAYESAGDGIARADPGGHCATGSDIPSASVEAFDCRFEPRLRLGQVGPGSFGETG